GRIRGSSGSSATARHSRSSPSCRSPPGVVAARQAFLPWRLRRRMVRASTKAMSPCPCGRRGWRRAMTDGATRRCTACCASLRRRSAGLCSRVLRRALPCGTQAAGPRAVALYAPRAASDTVLHGVVREHLETFLAAAAGRPGALSKCRCRPGRAASWWNVQDFPRSAPMPLVLIALALLAACVIVQSLGTLAMIHWVARVRQVFESPNVVRRVGLLLGIFTFIVLLHLIQIALWAGVFW